MRRAPYIGDNPGVGGSSYAIGQINYFASDPGATWMKLDGTAPLSEKSIRRARKTGGLPATPVIGGISFIAPGSYGTSWNGNSQDYGWPAASERQFFLVTKGRGLVASKHAVGANKYWSQTTLDMNGAGSIYWGNWANTDTTVGACFVNGEVNIITSTGIYASGTGDLITGPGSEMIAALTRYGTGYIAANSAYNQLCYGAGNYVAFAVGGVAVPKYSTGRVTWASCTLPSLNADGSSAGGTIVWIIWDDENQRFISITAYGETVVSTDGITFTKTNTRAGGATTYALTEVVLTNSGKLIALGGSAGNGQYYEAADINSAFVLKTMTIAGKTFASRGLGVAYSCGVAVMSFNAANSTTQVQSAITVDDAVTWKHATGGNGTKSGSDNTTGPVLAMDGVFHTMSNVTTGNVGGYASDRLTTDVGNMMHTRQCPITDITGSVLSPYMRIA